MNAFIPLGIRGVLDRGSASVRSELSQPPGPISEVTSINLGCRSWWAFLSVTIGVGLCFGITRALHAEPTQRIVIDGNFSDWATVPSHSDPLGGTNVLHDGIPDTHDTDHSGPNDIPV